MKPAILVKVISVVMFIIIAAIIIQIIIAVCDVGDHNHNEDNENVHFNHTYNSLLNESFKYYGN